MSAFLEESTHLRKKLSVLTGGVVDGRARARA